MSRPDHRLIAGLKALEPRKILWQTRPATRGAIQAGENTSLLSLEALVQRRGEPLPENKLLGVCEAAFDPQGLPYRRGRAPFLVDLADPASLQPGEVPAHHQPEAALAPGSLLVAGDPGSGKTRLLRRLLLCAAAHNTPEQAGFYLAAHQPSQFSDIGHLEHCRLVMQTFDRALGPAVQELVDLAEERRAAQQSEFAPAGHSPGPTPALILVIDDLASALLSLTEQSITLLYWLIRHGPRQRVWTLATLSSRRTGDLDVQFLDAFRSRLVGHISDPPQAHLLSGSHGAARVVSGKDPARTATGEGTSQPALQQGLPAWELEKGRQFFLPYGSGWLRFRLCDSRARHAQARAVRLWSGTA